MHESQRIARVNSFIKKHDVLCYKIQAQFNNGIADCYYAGKSGQLWIEYKQVRFPVRETTQIKPDLSKLQLKFLADHQRFGHHVRVIIFSNAGHFILTNYEHWAMGVSAKKAKSMLLPSYKDIANEILQIIN